MKESRNKYLLKNTLIFTIGNMGSKLITFFLIPLYTGVLSTTEYGITDLINTISIVVIPLLTLNISESVMRFALDKDADKDKISQIGTVILLCASIIGIGTIPICGFFDQISYYRIYVYFYIVSSAACQLYLADLRGKELLIQYSLGNIVLTLSTALFNILFLLILHKGIAGYLGAYILANFITAIYALLTGKGYRSFILKKGKLDIDKMKEMIRFSVVLIPNAFMWWIMNASDRIMVSSMVGVAANGIYAISYKLPTLVSTITIVFNQAWSYSAIREEGADDEEQYSNIIFKNLTVFVMSMGIVLLAIMKPFLNIYVNQNYYKAWKYTPFLIIGFVFSTLGTFISTSYNVHKDSMGYLLSATFGAGFNIVLNFILIPKIKIYGAAIATCISYCMVFVFRLAHTRKYIKYNINNRKFIIGTILLILESIFMFLDNICGQCIQLLICIILVIAYRDILIEFVRRFLKPRIKS